MPRFRQDPADIGGVLAVVAPLLACPVCGQGCALAGRAVTCPAGHSFDLARQGYVSLLPGGGAPAAGDDASMVAARVEFLASGAYSPLARELARAARVAIESAERAPGRGPVIADIGAGTGYYLAEALAAIPDALGLAIDASKFAARRAAGAHPRAASVVADAWRRLPLQDGVVDVALCVFAPRPPGELRRVLRAGGAAVVLTPEPNHLAELVAALGLLRVDERKAERLAASFAEGFTLRSTEASTALLELGAAAAENLVLMGPSAHHVGRGELRERLASLSWPRPVSVSARVSTFVAS